MRRTVMTYIQGGLGNQLFCYAFAYALAKMNNANLVIDLYEYERGYFREYQLNRLCVEYKKKYNYHVPKLTIAIRNHFYYSEAKCYEEKEQYFYDETVWGTKKTVFRGFWQNERYFTNYKSEIINTFRLRNSADIACLNQAVSLLPKGNTVAVHVRRGDYVELGRSIGREYYSNAFDEAERRIENALYVYFSDDIEWIKDNLPVDNQHMIFREVCDINDDLIELFVMSNCRHQVIANSTYSWWAAYLNQNKEKQVFVPNLEWLVERGFFLEEWIKVGIL